MKQQSKFPISRPVMFRQMYELTYADLRDQFPHESRKRVRALARKQARKSIRFARQRVQEVQG